MAGTIGISRYASTGTKAEASVETKVTDSTVSVEEEVSAGAETPAETKVKKVFSTKKKKKKK